MPDLLVKLYELPPMHALIDSLAAQGITIRRAIAPEKYLVTAWVRDHFGAGWASETDVAFSNHPPTVFVAVHEEKCVGFACCDATMKNFFGPTGVDDALRGRGIGRALLLACLHDMWARGYAYAIIGAAGPVDFYAKAVGATVIEGSTPGIYRGMLREINELLDGE